MTRPRDPQLACTLVYHPRAVYNVSMLNKLAFMSVWLPQSEGVIKSSLGRFARAMTIEHAPRTTWLQPMVDGFPPELAVKPTESAKREFEQLLLVQAANEPDRMRALIAAWQVRDELQAYVDSLALGKRWFLD